MAENWGLPISKCISSLYIELQCRKCKKRIALISFHQIFLFSAISDARPVEQTTPAVYVPQTTPARPTQPPRQEVTTGYNYPVPDVTLPIRPVTTPAPIITTPATLYGAPPPQRQSRTGRRRGGRRRGRNGRKRGRRVKVLRRRI